MTRERYEELRAAGPVIAAEDEKRLRSFIPRVGPVTYYVWLAFVRPNTRVSA